ncbi:alpha/beta hydrolase [Hanstruepera marina]|uniref:alpha/beta hydrolase n=1 Tax=Hanstruepera marina TaxID=2873265 RepID=UPI001CA6ADFD|nr:alpha/beta hydrolase [Hanstruepera marina]
MKYHNLIKILFFALLLTNCKKKSVVVEKKPQTVLHNKQEVKFSPPGKLYNVKGHNMHVLLAGENQKGPTVVLFHGAGDIALNWNLVLPEVGQFTKAVAIDQAGEGWSEHGHGMALNQQVYDTHELLKEANFSPPYILVGHSLGGVLANLFAKEYKDEVAGIVLVDATHPDVVLKVYNKELKKMEWKKMRLTAKDTIPTINTTYLEFPKKTKSFQPKKDFGDMLEKFSNRDKQLFNWIYNERPWTYVKGEGKTYEAEIFQEMFQNKEKYLLENIPLIVISAGQKKIKEGDSNWSSEQLLNHSKSLQKDLLNLSSNSKQIIAAHSGHHVHIDEPEVVSKAIKDLIDSSKQ